MSKCIYGNTVGAGGLPKSYILETEDGTQLVGVLVGEETIFDATDNDVREGKTYASDNGVSTGTKFIPSYHTTQTIKVIPSNSNFLVKLPWYDTYDYTELQAIICPFEQSLTLSVKTEKVVINNNVYNALSADAIATLSVNHDTKTIEFNIVNTGEVPYLIRLFTYKEIY